MFSYKKFDELCNDKNVTAYQVSNVTGVATSTLSMWKQGKYIPKVDKIQKIADYFNVPVTYFLEEGSK
jgi:transcriptional regulator with XRE-family HTH domain